MTFFGLVSHNVWTKKVRSVLTALAVAIGVMVVITLGIITQSLKTTAAGVLQTGKADFTVAQRGASDILLSSLTQQQVQSIQHTQGVRSAVGVLLDTEKTERAKSS
jgi:putative ABC transport system permease protein